MAQREKPSHAAKRAKVSKNKKPAKQAKNVNARSVKPAKADLPTPERILDAATRLFYDEGIGNVSVDAIAAKAGLTKRSFYYHYKSKDDLIAAYLQKRDMTNLKLFSRWYEEAEGPLDARIERLFDHIAQSARHPRWKGCGFLRSAAEFAKMPGHPAIKIGSAHKKKIESWLAQMIDEALIGAEQSGRKRARAAKVKKWSTEESAALARQITLLMDGAFAIMLVHKDPDYIEAAGQAAGALVRQKMT